MGHNRKNASSDSTNPSEPELKDWCFLTTVSLVSKVQQQLRPGQSTGSWSQISTVWRNRMIGCSVRKLSLSSKPKFVSSLKCFKEQFSSVQFSRSVMSHSLQPHEPQQARPPCPSQTPRVHPNPCPLSRWCQPTISSSVVLFSSCLQISQHQGLFKWVSSLHQVAKVSEFQLQHQSLQWTPRTDLL